MRKPYQMLHQWHKTPFVWGESDCCLCLADWYEFAFGDDPAKHLRGTYYDALSCRQTGWFNDPVAVIQGCLDTVGAFSLVDKPSVGDVAVLALDTHNRGPKVGALWLGTAWATKTENGGQTLHAKAARPLAIWGLGYEE